MHYIIENLNLFRRGKVREVYDLGDKMLFVASDRISAFDVIMDRTVPDKGKILTSISKYWFDCTSHIIENHFISSNVDDYPDYLHQHKQMLQGRSMLVKKAKPLPVEFVVRGYVAGSSWKEYLEKKTICGIRLPDGLQEFSKLDKPIFTPATKAETGHDENIDFDTAADLLGKETADYLMNISIQLYSFAHDLLEKKGIILADTKFEFGINSEGKYILIDEALTPDSSRFWLKSNYQPGVEQTNFDKQVLRDFLETLDWNKQYPPPQLPDDIIHKAAEKYKLAFNMIVGDNSYID
ncbi:MAG: phosphoribosylaminoimidazolesuccinocarboxamide synthase [Candidatus Kapaibacterium sp.]|jgi:phosphoribosylaminoimidazole-succinocarboxamide synthase|nr:phosphoribosylaminoimidazolesuccinocarboxamide synthase [Candidatus Kapabacteria bacterium]